MPSIVTIALLGIMIFGAFRIEPHQAVAKVEHSASTTKSEGGNGPAPASGATLSPTPAATSQTPSETVSTLPPTSTTPVTSPTSTPTPTPTPSPTPTPPAPMYTYKNGTYYAVGSFAVPDNTEKIGISLTINGDTITSSAITRFADNRTSQAYETSFINNYQPYVIGKSLASLKLSKISSASLTPIGFNNALAQIRSQAHN